MSQEQPTPIEGTEVESIRPMTDEEMRNEGWDPNRPGPNPTAIELDTGLTLYPSRDDEGNGPGALFGLEPDGTPIRIYPGQVPG